jgi:hypothetical protein
VPSRGEVNESNPALYSTDVGAPYFDAQREMIRGFARNHSNVHALDLKLYLKNRSAGGRRIYGRDDGHLDEYASACVRATFLAAAPAQSEDQLGEVIGVGTSEAMTDQLVDAGVDLAPDTGVVGGVTGTLVNACYQADVPAILLLVRADPNLPDPAAARTVIDTALEPLVDFEIDTEPLEQEAERIKAKKAQIAQELQSAQEAEPSDSMQSRVMYQ